MDCLNIHQSQSLVGLFVAQYCFEIDLGVKGNRASSLVANSPEFLRDPTYIVFHFTPSIVLAESDRDLVQYLGS